jgi:hypothetical protein
MLGLVVGTGLIKVGPADGTDSTSADYDWWVGLNVLLDLSFVFSLVSPPPLLRVYRGGIMG